MLSPATHRCAVLGSPVAHSLSPVLHRAAYAALGLTDWAYDAHEIDAAALPGFLAGCGPEWVGLSLTMPLKAAALAAGEPSPTARLVGAANTLLFDHATGRHRVDNTDVGGMSAALRAAGIERAGTALVLGSGATARSALAALAPLGVGRVTVVARSLDRAHAGLDRLADALEQRLEVQTWDAPVVAPADVTVSTVPADLDVATAARIAAVSGAVFDILYDPWPTRLAAAATAAGVRVLDGIDLLVHQAVGQVRLMTGRRIDPAVLMSAGRAALAARRGQ